MYFDIDQLAQANCKLSKLVSSQSLLTRIQGLFLSLLVKQATTALLPFREKVRDKLDYVCRNDDVTHAFHKKSFLISGCCQN